MVNAVVGASGRATIGVRATDSGGLVVDASITIDVNHTDSAPIITDFYSSDVGAGTRIYSGHVVDPDDNPSGLIVYVYGDEFERRCTTDDEGDFAFAVIFDPDYIPGYEYATARDQWGLESNTREDWAGVT